MTKNILHLIETTGPGGAENVFVSLVEGTEKQNFKSFPCITGPGWVYDSLLAKGIKPYIVFNRSGFDCRLLLNLIRIVRTLHIDIVHSHFFDISIYACIAARITRKKMLCTLHGFKDVKDKSNFFRLKKLLLNSLADRIVGVSNVLVEHFCVDLKFKKNKCNIIYNGIDLQRCRATKPASKKELGFDDQSTLIGMVGNLRSDKGHDNFIRTASLLLKHSGTNKNLYFIVAGQYNAKDKNVLDNLIYKEGITDRIHFIGYRSDVLSIVKIMDVFVVPSHFEGFSITTIEAMAIGVPVVSTRCGGPEEIIQDGVNGLLVPKKDPVSMANAISYLLDNKEVKQNIINNAEKKVNQFDSSVMINSYLTLYNEI